MKKIIIAILFSLPLLLQAKNITSYSAGGTWSSTGTWIGGVVPGTNDTATIAGPVTVGATTIVTMVTINSGITLTINSTFDLRIEGKIINNGSLAGGGILYLAVSGGTVVYGGGSWSSHTGSIYFGQIGTNGTYTIDSTVSIIKSTGGIVYNTGTYVKVYNKGVVEVPSVTNNSVTKTCWQNAPNAYLEVYGPSFLNSTDTLNASATGNTVNFSGTATIKQPVNKTFYKLVIASQASSEEANIPSNLSVDSLILDATALLDLYGDSISVSAGMSNSGAFINSGGTTHSTGIVKVGGTTVVSIAPPSARIVSTSTGGNWTSTSTWLGGIVPCGTDTAEIAGSVTANHGLSITKVIVDASKIFTAGPLTITDEFVNNGSVTGSSTSMYFTGNGITVLAGSGSWTSYSGYLFFRGTSQTIAKNTYIATADPGYLMLDSYDLHGPVTVYNYGHVNAAISQYEESGSTCTWVNDTNAYVYGSAIVSSYVTVQASAPGDTVVFGWTNAGGLEGSQSDVFPPASNTYWTLMTEGNNYVDNYYNLTVKNLIVRGSNVFNMEGSNMTVTGNWINNSSISNNTGTVTFNGSTDTIGGTVTTTFKNLTINSSGTAYLNHAEIISGDLSVTGGTLNCQTYPLTGNTTDTLKMSSGTNLVLGSTSSSTNVSFPYKFTSNHILLNSNSTVTYQANANQTISDTATYGNLTLNTGSSSTSKTPSSSTIAITGSLTINSNTTLPEGTGTINLTGNLNNSGTLSFSGSGTLNIGGNFTNNGTFTQSTSTVVLNGTGGQTIGGSTSTTFYNLTGGSSGTETITLSNNESVSNNFTVNSGATYTLSGGYNLNVAGTFTNNGSLTANSGTVVMDGGGAQSIGGSNATSFYNLTINPSGSYTTTLGNNETVSNMLLLSAGTLDVSTSNYNITVGGNFTNNATFTARNGTIILSGTLGQTLGGSNATNFYNLTGGTSGSETVTLGIAESVSNNFTINSSATYTIACSSYNFNIGGNFTNSGSITVSNGTVEMNGSSSQTLGGSSTITLYKLVIGTSGTTTLGGNITTSSDVTINSGATLNLSTYTLTLAGNFTDNGTFNCNTGTVYFDDNGKQCIASVHSSETFDNLTVGSLSKLGTSCSYLNLDGNVVVLPGGQMQCACN